MLITAEQMKAVCMAQLRIADRHYCNETLIRRIRAAFGFDPYILSKVWSYFVTTGNLPIRGEPKHLLWMLSFLKSYCSYDIYASWYGCTQATFRKWVWKFVHAVATITSIVSTNFTNQTKYVDSVLNFYLF
jgi:hypothetical protein